jgi:hypothetical protein
VTYLKIIYSNAVYWTSYGVSWLVLQAGLKHILRAFRTAREHIDANDSARRILSAAEVLPDPMDDAIELEDVIVDSEVANGDLGVARRIHSR